jgi:plasmid stabilization system protein ParE
MDLENYNAILSDKASNDIDVIYNYILKQLLSNQGADHFIDRITRALQGLSIFPYVGFDVESKYGKQVSYLHRVRGIVVDKYLIFYFIQEEKRDVVISRIVGSQSNYIEILSRDNI